MKPESKTEYKKLSNKSVKIIHSQAVKQSIGYQTGDVMYGVEIVVEDDPKAIRKGLARCEQIVEDALGSKLEQTQKLLRALATNNGGRS